MRLSVAEIDDSGQVSVILLSGQVVLDLAARMLGIEWQDIQDGMHDVPMSERGAVAVPRANLFPRMRKRRQRGPHASDVEIRHVAQMGSHSALPGVCLLLVSICILVCLL